MVGEMHPLVQRNISAHLSMIGKIHKLNVDIPICEEIMPEARIWLDSEINIVFAVKAFSDVKEILAKFAKHGIMLKTFNKSDTHPTWVLITKSGNTIRLSPEWKMAGIDDVNSEGVTCKLVKVGETTQVTPIYKLVCNSNDGESI